MARSYRQLFEKYAELDSGMKHWYGNTICDDMQLCPCRDITASTNKISTTEMTDFVFRAIKRRNLTYNMKAFAIEWHATSQLHDTPIVRCRTNPTFEVRLLRCILEFF